MQEVFELAVAAYTKYFGNYYYQWIFLAALLVILLVPAAKGDRKLMLGYSAFFGFIYLCPITAKIIMEHCIGSGVYWRMFWLLPMPIMIAYGATRLVTLRRTGKKKTSPGASIFVKAVISVCLLCVFMFGGYFMYDSDYSFVKAENLQKLPSKASSVCEIIKASVAPGEEAKAAVPEGIVSYIRQYDASIKLAYGRKGTKSKVDKKIYEQMIAENPDFEQMIKYARAEHCNYIVYTEGEQYQAEIESQGFQAVESSNGYTVYKDSKVGE